MSKRYLIKEDDDIRFCKEYWGDKYYGIFDPNKPKDLTFKKSGAELNTRYLSFFSESLFKKYEAELRQILFRTIPTSVPVLKETEQRHLLDKNIPYRAHKYITANLVGSANEITSIRNSVVEPELEEDDSGMDDRAFLQNCLKMFPDSTEEDFSFINSANTTESLETKEIGLEPTDKLSTQKQITDLLKKYIKEKTTNISSFENNTSSGKRSDIYYLIQEQLTKQSKDSLRVQHLFSASALDLFDADIPRNNEHSMHQLYEIVKEAVRLATNNGMFEKKRKLFSPDEFLFKELSANSTVDVFKHSVEDIYLKNYAYLFTLENVLETKRALAKELSERLPFLNIKHQKRIDTELKKISKNVSKQIVKEIKNSHNRSLENRIGKMSQPGFLDNFRSMVDSNPEIDVGALVHTMIS